MSDFRKNRGAQIACYVLIATLAGCSGQPQLGGVPKGETLAIRLPEGAVEGEDNVSNKAIASDAKTGAGAGALTGAAWGLSCGFFAIICSPIGALAGAVVGGSSGAIVGSVRGLSAEQEEQLTANIANYLQSHNASRAMYDALVDRASKEWIIVDHDNEDKELSVAITTLQLKSQGSDKIFLTMSLLAQVSYTDAGGKRQSRKATFDYESPTSPVNSWVNNHNDFITRQFEASFVILSENIVGAMMKRSG
jgi:uncharacterized membrane protein